MPFLDLQGVRVIEQDSSFQYAEFTVSLDQAAFAPTRFYYYVQDGTASTALNDVGYLYATGTILAGSTSTNIRVPIYGDTRIEGNETFQVVLLAAAGTQLRDNAAYLVATGTIVDDDDGIADAPAGPGAAAVARFGPESASATLPTLTVRDVTVIEGDSSFEYAQFLVVLDRPATAPVRVAYHTQERTASVASNEISDTYSTLTIPAGEQVGIVRVAVYGDTVLEGHETFQLVFTDISNAVFAGNASALIAEATIADNETSTLPAGGIGGEADQVFGPASAGSLPTMRISNIDVIEADSSFDYANFLVTFDRPLTAPARFTIHTQDVTASGAARDYEATTRTVTLPAGTESSVLRVAIYGDVLVEGNETFELVASGLTGAQFEGGAAALVTTATILDDDSGPLTGPGGIGNPAEGIDGPASASSILPTLAMSNVSVIEGNSSFDYAYFLITLDRPATSPITVTYSTTDGSANGAVGDYEPSSGNVMIAAGVQSTYLRVPIYGDVQIEGDENFFVVLTGITNAVFDQNAAALVGQVRILDNDGGPLSGPAGLESWAPGVIAPDAALPGVTAQVFSTSLGEGNSSFDYARVYMVLSEAASVDVRVSWSTVAASATEREDFATASGTLTIEAGKRSGFVQVPIYGDVDIESDESLQVSFTGLTGATFAGGGTTSQVSILIRDNDGGGTAGSSATGPGFDVQLAATNGADVLNAIGLNNRIDALAGNDVVFGSVGDDTILGGSGNDSIDGGAGEDSLTGGLGNDTMTGGADDDVFVLRRGDGADRITDFQKGATAASGDKLDVSGHNLNFAAIGFQSGSEGLRVTLGSDSVLLQGVGLSRLDASDFIGLSRGNTAPTVMVDDLSLRAGQTTALAPLVTAGDADGDAIQTYRIWDGTAGGTVRIAGQATSLTQQDYRTGDLADVTLAAASAAGSQTLWMQVFDGQAWSAWDSFVLETTRTNTAPTVSVSDLSLGRGQSAALAPLVTAQDADGDTLTYRIWDGTAGGTVRIAGQATSLTQQDYRTDDLADVTLVAAATAGSQTLWMQVHDGQAWSAWDSFVLQTTAANRAPTVTVDDLALRVGQTGALAPFVTAQDPDGDAIQTYRIWDGTAGGTVQIVGQTPSTSRQDHYTDDLAKVTLSAAATAGNQTLWMQVHDGQAWSAWDSFVLQTTAANRAPTVAVDDLALRVGQSEALAPFVTVQDPDGDTIQTYRIWDGTAGGTVQIAGQTPSTSRQDHYTSDLSTVTLAAAASPGNQTLWMQVFDGQAWSAWDSFVFRTTPANTAPTVAVQNLTLQVGQTAAISPLVTAQDAEGDALTYRIWDGNAGGTVQNAGQALDTAQRDHYTDDLSGVTLSAAASPGGQTLWMQVHDGQVWSAWDSFAFNTIA